MATDKEIRDKIGTIKSTRKITNAMEKVAAGKMRKAQDRMLMARPYAQKIHKVIGHVAASHSEFRHPYLEVHKEVKRVGFIIVSSDRGLCGGLNLNMFRNALKKMKEWSDKGVEINLCLVGRKAEAFFKRYGGRTIAHIDGLGDEPGVQDLIGVLKVMLDAYDKDEVDMLFLMHNTFINTMVQRPSETQLLPLVVTEGETEVGYWDYIYEPEAKALLTTLLVRYMESQLYAAVIENIACFQAAQMVSMRSATDNATDMIRELQLDYNKARQSSITQEIAEIVGGAAAVSGEG